MNAKETAGRYLDALNNEDFATARTLVTDDMVFDGVLGKRNSAAEYFADMEKMKMKYEVIRIFGEEQEACILCRIAMGDKKIFTCIWYSLEEGKIKNMKAVFDPTPLK